MYVLAIDQGTTSSRALVLDRHCQVVGLGQHAFAQSYPHDGWVEHDPEAIWQTVVAAVDDAIAAAGIEPGELSGCGITNQRETVIIWERDTGRPIYPAIVWQDRRTAPLCQALRRDGIEPEVQQKTGLILDPYFSATKLGWILEQVPGARQRAEAGQLAAGTVDTFLLWRLTGGRSHCTEATNACRSLLFDLERQCWDEDLLKLFGIPAAMMPEIRDTVADFGAIELVHFGARVPVAAMVGDQQGALVGQSCFAPGQAKSTYGTGCFLILNTGADCVRSRSRLLSTVAYRIGGEVTYAMEGSIFIAGAAIQWLRDGLRLIGDSAESAAIAERHGSSRGVYLVPAFTGLGAPYWDPDARGAITGLTRDSSAEDLVVAALEAVAFQTRDLIEAIATDGYHLDELRIDGGMANNDWFMQSLADIAGVAVSRPANTETTALGAGALALLGVGAYSDLSDISGEWRAQVTVQPVIDMVERDEMYRGWQEAVRRVTTT